MRQSHREQAASRTGRVNEMVAPVQNSLQGARTKWTDEQVEECRKLRAEGLTLQAIEDRTGIPHRTAWTFVARSRRSEPLAPSQGLEASR